MDIFKLSWCKPSYQPYFGLVICMVKPPRVKWRRLKGNFNTHNRCFLKVFSDFSGFGWVSIAIIWFSGYGAEIFGDNPSFRIYERMQTHALLRLANVVSPLHSTRECGWTWKVDRRKDTWYQDYLESAALSHVGNIPAACVPKTAQDIWTQAASSLVETTINQDFILYMDSPKPFPLFYGYFFKETLFCG